MDLFINLINNSFFFLSFLPPPASASEFLDSLLICLSPCSSSCACWDCAPNCTGSSSIAAHVIACIFPAAVRTKQGTTYPVSIMFCTVIFSAPRTNPLITHFHQLLWLGILAGLSSRRPQRGHFLGFSTRGVQV